MKKLLFFAILVFSFNAIAQGNRPPIKIQLPTSNKIENVQCWNTKVEGTAFGIFSGKNLGHTALHRTVEQVLSIQLYDSIYQWYQDTDYPEWQLDSKIANMTYDDNNNLTGFILQGWYTTGWENYDHYIFTFDENNNQTSLTYQIWDGIEWMNQEQYTATFDANNNQTALIYQIWNGSSWENYIQVTYTYDNHNNRTSLLFKIWNGIIWTNYGKIIYTYDVANNQTSETDQYWYGFWENSDRYTYTYDAKNNRISEIDQYWDANAWVDSDRNTYTYDANNNQTCELDQYWDGSSWVNYNKIIFTYDANNNQTNELDQNWNGSTWENSYTYVYTYDASNNQTCETNQTWNGSIWLNRAQYTYTYDANNYLESNTNIYFDETGTVVVNGDSSFYFSHTLTGTKDLSTEDSSIAVYPNPSGGKFTINSETPIKRIEIFNLPGEMIYSDAEINEHSSTEINLSSPGAGIYFVNIYDGSKIYNKMIVIQ